MIELYDLATLQIRMNRLLFGYTMIKGSKGIIDACLHAIRCIPFDPHYTEKVAIYYTLTITGRMILKNEY